MTTFASWLDAPVKISQILVEVHALGAVGSKDGSSDDEAAKFPTAKRLSQRLHDESLQFSRRRQTFSGRRLKICVSSFPSFVDRECLSGEIFCVLVFLEERG